MNKTDINNLGKVLYGTAIMLIATDHRFVAAAVFLMAIIMIVSTMETLESPADYINSLFYALGIGSLASAIVQLLLANILAFALLLLAGLAFMYLYRFLDKYFSH